MVEVPKNPLALRSSKRFEKDVQRLRRSGRHDLAKLEGLIRLLLEQQPIPLSHRSLAIGAATGNSMLVATSCWSTASKRTRFIWCVLDRTKTSSGDATEACAARWSVGFLILARVDQQDCSIID